MTAKTYLGTLCKRGHRSEARSAVMRRQSAHDRRRVTSSASCCELRSPLCGNHVRGTVQQTPLDRRQDGATKHTMRAAALLAIVLTATACDEDTSDDDAASGSMSSTTPDEESSSGEDEGSSSDDAPVDPPSAEFMRCNGLIGCIDTQCNEKRMEWQACKDDNICTIEEANFLWESYEGCARGCATAEELQSYETETTIVTVFGEAWSVAEECVDRKEKACELLEVMCVEDWW